jgi:predicted adenine nucleotide alpha hydrolase (AANH) superfamily ATPase
MGSLMNRNYSRELDQILQNPQNRGKHLFLHSCCAPCSSYVLEYLREFFRITVFYYNPNISQEEEYYKRVREQKRLIQEFNTQVEKGVASAYPIKITEGIYSKELFFERVRGVEHCREGGERCFVCYKLRLEETARGAKEAGADYFTTTLSISPLKNAAKINEIGEALSLEYQVAFLPSDFKKKDGYRRSVELSKEYDLYRQDYCGCVFSKAERDRRIGGAEREENAGELLSHLGQLHTTEMGQERIKKNLSLQGKDAVAWCVEKIASPHALITRKGKNWYVETDGCLFTINAYSYTIITAHRMKQCH